MAHPRFLAIDLGAESGRGVVGEFDGRQFRIQEVHRFPNGPVRVFDSLHWDALYLWREIQEALRAAVRQCGPLASVGVDTWAVDFGLVSRHGELVGLPYHYRDRRTEGMMEVAFAAVPAEEIFQRTGIQFLPFNTLYQLLAMRRQGSPLLEAAETLLMMGELFTYFMTGQRVAEFTNATTTQLYDPLAGTWAASLFARLDLPLRLMPPVIPPGTVVAPLLASVAEETGAGRIPVVAPAVHDTGSAVAAVPAQGEGWCYISSGTWSLMGVEVKAPVITPASRALNFTNEGGVAGTFRLLKNIMGLWLVQECRRQWEREGSSHSYAELTRLAEEAEPFRALVDPDHPDFLPPGDMPARLRAYCQRTGQVPPADKGALVRCALESLALRYRYVRESLEALTGIRIHTIHIVGGGSQNGLLNQFTADATGCRVLAGPVEATALGNILMQAIATGHLSSVAEGREAIRRSQPVAEYLPRPEARGAWDDAYQRWRGLIGSP